MPKVRKGGGDGRGDGSETVTRVNLNAFDNHAVIL